MPSQYTAPVLPSIFLPANQRTRTWSCNLGAWGRGHLTNPGQLELGGKHEQIGAYLPSPPIHRQPRSGAFAAVILTQYGRIFPPKERKEILIAQHGPARGNAEEALGGA